MMVLVITISTLTMDEKIISTPRPLPSNIKSISASLNNTIQKNIFGETFNATYDDFIYNTKLVTLSNYGYRRFTLNLIKSIDNLAFEKVFTLYIMTMDNKCINYFNCVRFKSYYYNYTDHKRPLLSTSNITYHNIKRYCQTKFRLIPTVNTNIVVINVTQTTIDAFNLVTLHLNKTIVKYNVPTFENGTIKPNPANSTHFTGVEEVRFIDKLKKIQLNWHLSSESNTQLAKIKSSSYAVISGLAKLAGLRYLMKDVWNYNKHLLYLDSDISIINSHIQHFLFDFIYLSKTTKNINININNNNNNSLLNLSDLSIYNKHPQLAKANVYDNIELNQFVKKALSHGSNFEKNIGLINKVSNSNLNMVLKPRNTLVMTKANNNDRDRGCAGIIFIESNKRLIDEMFNVEKYWGFEFDTNDQMYINMFNEHYYMGDKRFINPQKQNQTENENMTVSQVVTSGIIDFFPTIAFANGHHMKKVLKKHTVFHHQCYLGHFNGFKNAKSKMNAMRALKAWYLGNPKRTSQY